MNSVLRLAREMLIEHGEFFPYGGVVDNDGEIVHVGAKLEGTDRAPSQPLIELMKSEFTQRAREGKCRATAIIADVKVVRPGDTAKTDAIRVSLDHRDNYSVEVFFPYALVNGELVFDEVFALKGLNEIFSS
ncbi:MAG: hypothetical protein AB7O65_07590 [Candidatus Korobacteraceae bacterium]